MLFKYYFIAYSKVRQNVDHLQLHGVCYCEASGDCIMMLFKAYPKATKIQDEHGKFKVIDSLVVAYPKSIIVLLGIQKEKSIT
jgi:hypothetical protein